MNNTHLEGFTEDTISSIEKNQKEYDEHLKSILLRLERMETLIQDLKILEEKKEEKGMIKKVIDTTSYLHSFVDNVYFVGKVVMPIFIYYKLTK